MQSQGGYCNTACGNISLCPHKCWRDPTSLPHWLTHCPPCPFHPPNQAFPSSCAACWAHTAYGGSALQCCILLLRELGKGSAVTQQREYSRKGCLGSLMPATAPPALQRGLPDPQDCCGNREWCWLLLCSMALLLSPATAGAALLYPCRMLAQGGTEGEE